METKHLDSKPQNQTRGFRYSITGLLVVMLLIALLTTAYVWLNKEARHIHTEFWTNMPPPSEKDINRELAASVGDWITINGAAHSMNNSAAVWITENIVVAVPGRTNWPNRPSHRSHVMVTGFLVENDGQYALSKFEHLDCVRITSTSAPDHWYGALTNVRTLMIYNYGQTPQMPFDKTHLKDIARLANLEVLTVSGYAFTDDDARTLATSSSIKRVALHRTAVTAIGESDLANEERIVYRE